MYHKRLKSITQTDDKVNTITKRPPSSDAKQGQESIEEAGRAGEFESILREPLQRIMNNLHRPPGLLLHGAQPLAFNVLGEKGGNVGVKIGAQRPERMGVAVGCGKDGGQMDGMGGRVGREEVGFSGSGWRGRGHSSLFGPTCAVR